MLKSRRGVPTESLIEICGDVARLDLGRGRYAIIDVADVPLVQDFRWLNESHGYAVTTLPTLHGEPQKVVSLHRRLLCFPLELVDHKNRNPLDNRRSNLRLASRTVNALNKSKWRSKTTSKYFGVHFNRSKQQWIGKIRLEGKAIFTIGQKTALAAALGRDDLVRTLNLPAPVNFPERQSRILSQSEWKRSKAKLKIGDVNAIRELSRRGVSIPRMARWFGVARQTVHDVVHNRTWIEGTA